MKKYKQTLPRKIVENDTTPLCQRLDIDTGDSCDKLSAEEHSIFEAEDTGGGVHIVFFCKKHADLRFNI